MAGAPKAPKPEDDGAISAQILAAVAMDSEDVSVRATACPMELMTLFATKEEPEVKIIRHETEVAWPIMATSRLSRWNDKVRRVALIKKVLMTLLEKVPRNAPLSHQLDLDLENMN